MRHESPTKAIIVGRVECENVRDKSRMQFTKQMMVDTECSSYRAMKILAENDKCAGLLPSNLRIEHLRRTKIRHLRNFFSYLIYFS